MAGRRGNADSKRGNENNGVEQEKENDLLRGGYLSAECGSAEDEGRRTFCKRQISFLDAVTRN